MGLLSVYVEGGGGVCVSKHGTCATSSRAASSVVGLLDGVTVYVYVLGGCLCL